jgi:hypothetical protein
MKITNWPRKAPGVKEQSQQLYGLNTMDIPLTTALSLRCKRSLDSSHSLVDHDLVLSRLVSWAHKRNNVPSDWNPSTAREIFGSAYEFGIEVNAGILR